MTYRLADILKRGQDYLHGCNANNLLNAAQLHFRDCINSASNLSCNLVNQQTERKVPFAIAFLVCGTLRGGFETIPI